MNELEQPRHVLSRFPSGGHDENTPTLSALQKVGPVQTSDFN